MRKLAFIIIIFSAILQVSCVEKEGYYTNGESSIIALICDITWVSKKTINNEGTTYQGVYKFNKNGTYTRVLIVTDKDENEQQSTINGQWSFTDKSMGTIYFGSSNYWDINELTNTKMGIYERSGELGESGMTREYQEFTPKE